MKVYTLIDSTVLPKGGEYHRAVGNEAVDCDIASVAELEASHPGRVIRLPSGFEAWSSLFVAEAGHFLRYASTSTCTYATTCPTDKVAVLEDGDVVLEDNYNREGDDESYLVEAFYRGPNASQDAKKKMTSTLKRLGDTPSLRYWRQWLAGDWDASKKFRERVKAPVI